ncbi:hypothetical protein [Rhodohalobacter sulfatireducens]|nr:hypothetical protein [Rhodohalobacter sulfatireducens]
MRKVLFLILLSAVSTTIYGQSAIEKIRALNLHSIEGPIKTYYSEGFKDRAEDNFNLLSKSIEFFENQFDLQQSFSIAIIDSVDWKKISSIPYGLPFVSGPPYVVCIPAQSNNELSNIVASSTNGYELEDQYEMSNEEIVNLFVSLIGFHELGHIYANAYGAGFPNKWTFEFAATYFAYFYLDQHYPKKRDLWVDVSRILVNELSPRFTSLTDFEEMYVRVGIENYAWYQVVFLMRVKELYESKGKTFIEDFKNHTWSSTSSSEYIHEMEEIGSGFNSWAQRFHLR